MDSVVTTIESVPPPVEFCPCGAQLEFIDGVRYTWKTGEVEIITEGNLVVLCPTCDR